MVSAAYISTQSVYYVYPSGAPSFLPQIRPRQTHLHLMGLILAAVRLQPSNIAPGLTTTHTHKVSAENVPFVGIDESTVSAPLAGISSPSKYSGRRCGSNHYRKLPSLPLVSLPTQNHCVFLRQTKTLFGSQLRFRFRPTQKDPSQKRHRFDTKICSLWYWFLKWPESIPVSKLGFL